MSAGKNVKVRTRIDQDAARCSQTQIRDAAEVGRDEREEADARRTGAQHDGGARVADCAVERRRDRLTRSHPVDEMHAEVDHEVDPQADDQHGRT